MNDKEKNKERYREAIHSAGAIVWIALAWLVIIGIVVGVLISLCN